MQHIAQRYELRDFYYAAETARREARRWRKCAADFKFMKAIGAVRGVSSASDCTHMAIEWEAREALAMAYAERISCAFNTEALLRMACGH